MNRAYFQASIGDRVRSGDAVFDIVGIVSPLQVIGRNLLTADRTSLSADSLRPYEEPSSTKPAEVVVDLVPEADWKISEQRLAIIKPLLKEHTTEQVQEVARVNGKHPATIYRWLQLYADDSRQTILIPKRRGRIRGTKFIAAATEAIVSEVIEEVYLTEQRPRISFVIEEIRRRCIHRDIPIPPPTGNTVRRRIAQIPKALAYRRRGMSDVADSRHSLIKRHYDDASCPYAIVEIDHSPVDAIIVDEISREPLGRPWLTVAIDLFSRMILGINLSFDAPSFVTTGSCLAQAMLPKTEYLASLEISGEWPVWGPMGVVHCDNAKHFHGEKLERVCAKYGIILHFRRSGQKQEGGHIERMFGTIANRTATVPGATFAHVRARKGYDSEKKSAFTLKEFERWLVLNIIDVYHQQVHSIIGMPPIAKFKQGLAGNSAMAGGGSIPVYRDPERLRIDFMPTFKRAIEPRGVVIDHIHYTGDVLQPFMRPPGKGKPVKQLFHRDPEDITRCWFVHPDTEVLTQLAMLKRQHPPMTISELRIATKRARVGGRALVDEDRIYAALTTMRADVAAAQEKTAAARRASAARTPAARKSSPAERNASESIAVAKANDLFSRPSNPYEDDDE